MGMKERRKTGLRSATPPFIHITALTVVVVIPVRALSVTYLERGIVVRCTILDVRNGRPAVELDPFFLLRYGTGISGGF